MARSVLVLSWWLALLSTRHSLFFVGAYECHLTYPISLLQPVTGSYFSGNLSSDHLTCFGNREYLSVSYLDAIRCLVRGYGDCNGLWGSRAVVLETDGSMEMLRVQKLPAESVVLAQPLNASRWLQLSAAEEGAPTLRMDGTSRVVAKEAKQIPAEPVFFCARCNDWRANSSAAFTAQFRQAYLRQKDVVLCRKHMLVLVALTAASAAVPAISKLLVVAAGSYGGFHYGLQRFIMVYVVCMLCTVLLPFVRGKRTRRFIRYYMRAFLSKEQDQEGHEVLRSSMKMLDVIFFSSLTLTAGPVAVYTLFYYDWIVRETRNTIIKVLLAAAAGWISSFLSGMVEGPLLRWGWVGGALVVSRLVARHVNPGIDSQVTVAVFLTAAVSRQVALAAVDKLPLKAVFRLTMSQLAALLQLIGMRKTDTDRLMTRVIVGTPFLDRRSSVESQPAAAAMDPPAHSDHAYEYLQTSSNAVNKRKKKKKIKKRVQMNIPFFLSPDYAIGDGQMWPVHSSLGMQLDTGLRMIQHFRDISYTETLAQCSFDRTIIFRCDGEYSSSQLLTVASESMSAFCKNIPQSRPQSPFGETVLVCMLKSVSRSSCEESAVCVCLRCFIITEESKFKEELCYDHLFGLTSDMLVMFAQSYHPNRCTNPELQVLADLECLTRQIIMHITEKLCRQFLQVQLDAMPEVHVSDSESPFGCLGQIVIQGTIDIRRLVTHLSNPDDSLTKVMNPENLLLLCRRVQIANSYFQTASAARTRFLYSVLEVFKDCQTFGIDDFPDIDILSDVRIQIIFSEPQHCGEDPKIAVNLYLPHLICNLKSTESFNSFWNKKIGYINIFSPTQNPHITIGGVVLSVYFGKLVSLCFNDLNGADELNHILKIK